MAEPYRAQLANLINRIFTRDADGPEISCRHFFSGAAAYADDDIFMSLSPVGLTLKLPEKDCAELIRAGAAPLRYFPKAPVKKGYVVLPPDLADDDDALKDWIMKSLFHVRS
ncbi:MAG: TfoX/Sxy family protein [Hyphomicrobiales bacterium]|nr:TfoX/Sxy family protein [Hyphomicrobiales bacterium]MCP5000751.1 TfoX/Sxy family protein [Hyphomicrobiales bacterium]